MSGTSLEAWLANAGPELPAPELRRIVGLQVAVTLRDNHSPLRLRDGEVSAKWFGEAVALRDPSRPDQGVHNRVIGFHPGAVEHLDEWVSYYEQAGIPCQIDIAASRFTDAVRAALARRGFELAGTSRTSVADPRSLALPEHPEVSVEDVTPDTLAEVLQILAVAQGRPAVTPELI
ncbi:MAG: hypothetical protein U0263_41920, partial [Polyangiaceae bacterium]